METLKFKTNINCGGCVATVTPFLSGTAGIEKWEVDIVSPDKVLTVETDVLSSGEIEEVVRKAGFIIAPMSSC